MSSQLCRRIDSNITSCILKYTKMSYNSTNIDKNQRCIYHLSTNHKLIQSEDFKPSCYYLRNSNATKLFKHNILAGPSFTPILVGLQRHNIRHYSTQFQDNYFVTKLQKFANVLYDNRAVDTCQDYLIWLHETTGSQWWGTIVLSAVLMRTLLSLPIQMYMKKLQTRMANIQEEMKNMSKDVELDMRVEASRKKWTEFYTKRAYKFKMDEIYKQKYIEQNCHPFKIVLLPLLQIPPWILLSVSIRKLCGVSTSDYSWSMAHDELITGGFGWISDLTIPDPFFLLPISLFCINLTICEMAHLMKPESVKYTTAMKFVHNGFRILTFASGCVACLLPSGVVLFWTSISGISLGHMYLIERKKFTNIVQKLVRKKEPLINDVDNAMIRRKNKLLKKLYIGLQTLFYHCFRQFK